MLWLVSCTLLIALYDVYCVVSSFGSSYMAWFRLLMTTPPPPLCPCCSCGWSDSSWSLLSGVSVESTNITSWPWSSSPLTSASLGVITWSSCDLVGCGRWSPGLFSTLQTTPSSVRPAWVADSSDLAFVSLSSPPPSLSLESRLISSGLPPLAASDPSSEGCGGRKGFAIPSLWQNSVVCTFSRAGATIRVAEENCSLHD